jgi:hypothetical protein
MASIIKSDNGVSSGITGIVQSADSSGQLVLQTTTSGGTATTAVTIDNSQKVTFANSIGFGSNAGITFNNSSALTNSTLNDYETGTWTPTLSSTGATFTYPRGQYGSYVKIGSLVYAQFYIGASASGTTTNQCVIASFPFASANLSALAQSSGAAWISQTVSIGFTKNNNDTICTMWKQNVGSATTASASDVQGGYIVGMIVYQAF